MRRSPLPALFGLAIFAASASAAPNPSADASRTRAPIVSAPQFFDFERRLDHVDFDLWTTNFGALAYNISQGSPGFEYPRGSGKHGIFASGLWVGAKVGAEVRVTTAEYGQEWGPGRILGGLAEPTDAPGLQSWKVVTLNGLFSSNDTGFVASGFGDPVLHHGWAAYVAEAGATGAPVGTRRLPVFGNPADSVDVAGPDLPGDVALWSVFNDADPFLHTVSPGNTAPLGLEVRQTVFGLYGVNGTAFVRWTLVHRGSAPLDSAYVGFWCDPDIGGAGDDKLAFNEWHGLGYAYNGQNVDAIYGATPPAVGLQYLGGPNGVGLAAFTYAISGTDPNNALESYRVLQGFDAQGDAWIDPTTNLPTRFVFRGDPVTNQGWIDPFGVDKRMFLSVGPFVLSPGDSATFTFAIVAGQGLNRFDSIRRMECAATVARQAFNQGFTRPYPDPGPECAFVAACPVPAETWAGFCADPSKLPPGALDLIAQRVFAETRSLAQKSPDTDSLCILLSVSDVAPARARAEREYLAMLANLNAVGGIVSPDGIPVGVSGDLPVSCPWSGPTTLGQLAERAPEGTILDVTYVRVDNEPRDYQPVDWGGQAYGGGIDYGWSFLGSSLDPSVMPDSFPVVEIRFDPASTQKAYRYLRLEEEGTGAPPAGGREYRYGGYRSVPLEAIETATGERLELAFVERAVTDAAGTILPPGSQVATFDSTWAPSSEELGGREYLFVLRRPDSGAPRPEMTVDGAIIETFVSAPPTLYAAWLHRFADGDDPEPGEKFVIVPFATPPSPGSDARLLALAALPQDDPATLAGYEEIATCLAAINSGAGLGKECDVTTPVAITLEEGVVEDGAVRLSWYVGGQDAGPFDLMRRWAGDDAAPWSQLARLGVDGTRRVRYEDRAIAAGERWTYGLFEPAGGGHPLDVVTIEVPGAPAFALQVRGGARGTTSLHFTLPARSEVRLELFDALGRRHVDRTLGVREPGTHVEPLPTSGLARGLWFVRLTFEDQRVVAKAIALR